MFSDSMPDSGMRVRIHVNTVNGGGGGIVRGVQIPGTMLFCGFRIELRILQAFVIAVSQTGIRPQFGDPRMQMDGGKNQQFETLRKVSTAAWKGKAGVGVLQQSDQFLQPFTRCYRVSVF